MLLSTTWHCFEFPWCHLCPDCREIDTLLLLLSSSLTSHPIRSNSVHSQLVLLLRNTFLYSSSRTSRCFQTDYFHWRPQYLWLSLLGITRSSILLSFPLRLRTKLNQGYMPFVKGECSGEITGITGISCMQDEV